MVAVKGLKNWLRDQLASSIGNGEYGTGTTDATEEDTDLQTAVGATLKAVTTTKTDRQVEFTHQLTTAEGNGNDLSEFGIFLDDGTLLARVNFAPVTKQSTENWVTIISFRFV